MAPPHGIECGVIMHISKVAKPATDVIGEPAAGIEHLAGPLEQSNTLKFLTSQVRCNLFGDVAVVGDIQARGALDICRRLLDAGVDPNTELLCYRDDKLALRISAIGVGAKLVVRETATDGPRFVSWKPFPAAPSSRPFVKNDTSTSDSPDRVALMGDAR
jgi:hypothetical protein